MHKTKGTVWVFHLAAKGQLEQLDSPWKPSPWSSCVYSWLLLLFCELMLSIHRMNTNEEMDSVQSTEAGM